MVCFIPYSLIQTLNCSAVFIGIFCISIITFFENQVTVLFLKKKKEENVLISLWLCWAFVLALGFLYL